MPVQLQKLVSEISNFENILKLQIANSKKNFNLTMCLESSVYYLNTPPPSYTIS